jgi:hypothetical protein
MDAQQSLYCHECHSTSPTPPGSPLECPNCRSPFTELVRAGDIQITRRTTPQGEHHMTATIHNGVNAPSVQNFLHHLFTATAAPFPAVAGPQDHTDPNLPGFAQPRAFQPRVLPAVNDPLAQNDLALGHLVGLLNGTRPRRNPYEGRVHGPDPLTMLMNDFFAAHANLINAGDATDENLARAVSQSLMDAPAGGAPPTAPEVIAALHRVPVETSFLDENGKAECIVCKDDLQVGDMVTKLCCGHYFHGECVVTWLGEHNTCPICREKVEAPTETRPRRSSSRRRSWRDPRTWRTSRPA